MEESLETKSPDVDADDANVNSFIKKSRLTLSEERRVLAMLEQSYMRLLQRISFVGGWADYVQGFLAELLEQPADIRRSIVVSPSLSEADLVDLIRGYHARIGHLIKGVNTAWYICKTNPLLWRYLESRCTNSPLIFGWKDDQITIDVDPAFRKEHLGVEDAVDTLKALQDLAAAKQNLSRVISLIPFEGCQMLEELESYLASMKQYAEIKASFTAWETTIAKSSEVPVDAAEVENQYQMQLQSVFDGARIFPCDLDRLHSMIQSDRLVIGELREKLIVSSTDLMRWTIHPYIKAAEMIRITPDELESVGMAEMIRSMETFQWKKGTRFFTYVFMRIRGKMKELINRETPTDIPMIRNSELKRIKAAIERLKAVDPTKEPSIEDLCKETGYREKKLTRLLEALKTTGTVRKQFVMVSMQAPITSSKNNEPASAKNTVANSMVDENAGGVAETVEQQDMHKLVMSVINDALDKLPEQERLVLCSVFGLRGCARESFTAIGQRFGLRQSKVSQMCESAKTQIGFLIRKDPRIGAIDMEEMAAVFMNHD